MAATATALDMAVLVEAHNEEELKAALNLSDSLIGINNRNLHTFQTTLQTTLELLPLAKTANRTLISESGIKTAADVQLLQKAGVDAFLIGEACMRAEDPGAALRIYLFKHKKPAITDNQGRQGSIMVAKIAAFGAMAMAGNNASPSLEMAFANCAEKGMTPLT